jgi:putative FmdB family regulatory protein
MPMYDFECAKGHKFEALAKMDNEGVPCQEEGCGEVAVQAAVSRPRELTKLKGKLGNHANLSSLRFNFNWISD